ncbi:MAG: hypothetical protein AAB336_08695 [Acidobacteriota bacterium]
MKTTSYLQKVTLLSLLLMLALVPISAQPQDKSKDSKAKTANTSPASAPAPAADYNALMANMRFREIGPATMGGRINDIEVPIQDTKVVYAATASGGIWKSINAGTSWTGIFQNEEVSTIGDLAIAPSDPSVLYVGTGESNNRQSSSWGNGMYKSVDAGKTWQKIGLAETHHIGRVVVHPTDPNTVYVAAAGKLWGPSPERGVYKTTDGGKSWNLVLKVNDDTGASDIAIDRESPGILYASMYQRRRTVFGFNGSGEGSALYKTNDGGATWKKITNGMPYDTANAPTPRPEGLLETGRITVDIYQKNTNVVYAMVEHANGGIFRSTDKGETWTRTGDMANNPRPMYFSQIRIDPNNDQRLWIAGVSMQYSDDGGKTITGAFSRSPHADTHGIWINPNNSSHIVQGNDGGINITYDRGVTWEYSDTIPLAQFYEIGVDNSMPYKICGGLQDNNTWCGPSMSLNGPITNSDWYTIGGGDGFYAQPDPNDPDIVYAESQDGNLLRRNVKTGETRSIRPREEIGEKNFRFQWNSPIVISKYNSNTIYYGGNFLFKSTDRGNNWAKVSPDLTTNMDRNNLPVMGKVPDRNTRSRHDGVQNFPTITSVSESHVNQNVLWVGTDDGNLQVTKDGGANWKNVVEKVSGVPKGTYVSRVQASKHNEGTAYVTFDGHRNGDFKVYVYMTTDYGESWKSIVSNLPQNNGIANVIREHHRNPNLLFVGTEYGAYFSTDKGGSWTRIKLNLPTVPVDDILIHPRENDLILGTHGRAIWIMDDITPLEQLTDPVVNSNVHLFDIRQAIHWRTWNNKPYTGDKRFQGQNPPNGAMVNFYLKSELADRQAVSITIQDAAGQVVRTVNCIKRPAVQPQQGQGGGQGGFGGGGGGGFGGFGGGGGNNCFATQGLNRWVWDMRERSPLQQGGGGGFGGGGGGGGFGGGGQGSRVDPGDYTVKIKFGDVEMSKTVRVMEDPRINISAEDRVKKRVALAELTPVLQQGIVAQTTIVSMRANLVAAMDSWRRPGAPRVPDNVRKASEDLLKKIDETYINWGTPPSLVSNISQAGPPLVVLPQPLSQRAAQIRNSIDNTSAAPTTWELAQIQILKTKIPEAAGVVRGLVTELEALNKLMREANVPYIAMPAIGGGGGGGQRPPEEDYDQ